MPGHSHTLEEKNPSMQIRKISLLRMLAAQLYQWKGEEPVKDFWDLAVFPLKNAHSLKPKHIPTRCLFCFEKIFRVLDWHFWSTQRQKAILPLTVKAHEEKVPWEIEFHTVPSAWIEQRTWNYLFSVPPYHQKFILSCSQPLWFLALLLLFSILLSLCNSVRETTLHSSLAC